MKHYHIHIYFEPKDTRLAYELAERASMEDRFESVKIQEKPVGPHPTGMIEIHFGEPCYNKVIEWLNVNRGVLTAMVHEDTGDDFKDHTDGIRWLGKELPLDFSFFELILERPDLRIHQ